MKFNRVHAVCRVLRDKPCDLCPARENFGPGMSQGIRGCRLQAQEVVNIVQNGSPWRNGVSKHIKSWRKRFNKVTRIERAAHNGEVAQ